jgi:hypothetical protein
MVASLSRFRTRANRLKAQEGEKLRQLVLDYGDALPRRAVGEILLAIDRVTDAERDDWRFLLMAAEQFNAVADWLEEHSRRPRLALRLFRHLLRFVDPRTDEILRTREELAELVKARPDDVSTVMAELVKVGAVRQERVRVPGMKGPGIARWYLNPTIATSRPVSDRQRAQAEAPVLNLPDTVVRLPTRPRRRVGNDSHIAADLNQLQADQGKQSETC